jgi:hypothetical protein
MTPVSIAWRRISSSARLYLHHNNGRSEKPFASWQHRVQMARGTFFDGQPPPFLQHTSTRSALMLANTAAKLMAEKIS